MRLNIAKLYHSECGKCLCVGVSAKKGNVLWGLRVCPSKVDNLGVWGVGPDLETERGHPLKKGSLLGIPNMCGPTRSAFR